MQQRDFREELQTRFGSVQMLKGSRSLLRIGDRGPIIYARYSKTHSGGRTFFGLRRIDLEVLDSTPDAFVAFLWDTSPEPAILPWAEFRPLFAVSPTAADGQVKAQIVGLPESVELYLARAGKHPIDAYLGWWSIFASTQALEHSIPVLDHSSIQALLGGIGTRRGYGVWIPVADRGRLPWTLTPRFNPLSEPPTVRQDAQPALNEIDVVWVHPSSNQIASVFEVEHSTPVYSGLLRFNDLWISGANASQFNIVSDENRRDLFVRQNNRPTFTSSGLSERCGFLTYPEVYRWATSGHA